MNSNILNHLQSIINLSSHNKQFFKKVQYVRIIKKKPSNIKTSNQIINRKWRSEEQDQIAYVCFLYLQVTNWKWCKRCVCVLQVVLLITSQCSTQITLHICFTQIAHRSFQKKKRQSEFCLHFSLHPSLVSKNNWATKPFSCIRLMAWWVPERNWSEMDS